MRDFEELFSRFKLSVREGMCQNYGTEDDDELGEFIEELIDESFSEIRSWVENRESPPAVPTGESTPTGESSPIESRLSQIEQKLDRLLNCPRSVSTAPTPVQKTSSTKPDWWGRYQRAWPRHRKSNGESVPTHPGERSKLCAAHFAEFKKLDVNQREEFLSQWC